jgi:hypothetical protein
MEPGRGRRMIGVHGATRGMRREVAKCRELPREGVRAAMVLADETSDAWSGVRRGSFPTDEPPYRKRLPSNPPAAPAATSSPRPWSGMNGSMAPARMATGIDCSHIRPGPVMTAKWWPSWPM